MMAAAGWLTRLPLLLGAGVLVAGCGGAAEPSGAVDASRTSGESGAATQGAPTPARRTQSTSVESTQGPAVTTGADRAEDTGSTELPPGDPGLDAPAVPDPGAPGREHAHEPARRVVPAEAMLDADTVGAVLGGSWRPAPADEPACLRSAADAVAERTVNLAAGQARVVEVVATHPSPRAADRAVAQAERRLTGCGWQPLADPRLGSASTAAAGSPSTAAGRAHVTVVAAEGVTVTLIGSETAPPRSGRWSGLVDLALGNSCATAPDGCH